MVIVAPRADEVKASLKALRSRLEEAYRYSYGYQGCPAYIEQGTWSVGFRIQRLITSVARLERQCPGKFYQVRK